MNIDNCSRCDRILQQSGIAEATGLCDRCREASVLERTPLANFEYRVKTEEVLTEPRPSLRERIARLLTEDPDGCECAVCVKNWEDHG